MSGERGAWLSVIAPRGAAKSTLSSLALPLYAAMEGKENYIVISSDSGDQARLFLGAIRDEIETNELLQQDYPSVCRKGPIWRDDRLKLANGVQIDAVGTGTKMRGRRNRQSRPSLILVDDPQNTGHIISELQRSRSWDWLTKDVCNAGSPDTNIVVLGTALHREGIVNRLEKTPGWEHHHWKAIEQWPERMDLWNDWEDILLDWGSDDREENARRFYDQHKEDMQAGGSVFWPDRFPLYDLMLKRSAIGRLSFDMEMQGIPRSADQCEWPDEAFLYPHFWFDDWGPVDHYEIRTMFLDPSLGRDSKTGDPSAIVAYGRDKRGLELAEADIKRRNAKQMIDDLVAFAARFKPDIVGIESNAFQSLLMPILYQSIENHEKETGQILAFRIIGLENSVNKQVRIRRLNNPISERRLRLKSRSPGTMTLLEQLKTFPDKSAHDDGPDALECARRLAIQAVNGEL